MDEGACIGCWSDGSVMMMMVMVDEVLEFGDSGPTWTTSFVILAPSHFDLDTTCWHFENANLCYFQIIRDSCIE